MTGRPSRSRMRHRSKTRETRHSRDNTRSRSRRRQLQSNTRRSSRDVSRSRDKSRGRSRHRRENTPRERYRQHHREQRARTPSVNEMFSSLMTRIRAIENSNQSTDSTPACLVPAAINKQTGPRVDFEKTNNTRTHTPPIESSNNYLHNEGNPDMTYRDTDDSPSTHHGGNSQVNILDSAKILAEAIKSLQPVRSHSYFVSNFDPLIHNFEQWCAEVDRAQEGNGWNDHECLSRVASCLKGDARTWLNEWVTNDRTWSSFKQDIAPLCPRKLDYANILFDTMNTSSDKYPTYAEYARRTMLRLRIVKGLSDELMILIVIRGITDSQVRAAAANASLTSENIVSFLSIYNKTDHKQDVRNVPIKRRPHPNSSQFQQSSGRSEIKCYSCGQRGHMGRNCYKKPKSDSYIRKPSFTDANTTKPPSSHQGPVTCTFCKKLGHVEENCFAKNRSEPRNQRNVNLCADQSLNTNNDIVTAVVNGIPMDALIDSGAINISLISSDVLKHLSCQPKSMHCVLKGISDKEIIASTYVTVTIELSDISIEADLVVVPSKCMNTSIIIGTDILNRKGVVYVRTKDRQYLTHATDASATVNTVESDRKVDINTPLQGADREKLINVITEFSDFLISGTAITTVRTGKMDIKLTTQTPVVYRPYKLSYEEKLRVRKIVADLLDKGIIRESQSEYASPIILVKKKDGSDRLCVDFRALNRLTVRDRYPLPLIDDHIDRLGNYKYFSSLDMATGFHQIPLSEESVPLTGFVTPEGHFEYLKMPYGLTNSPIVYQRIINNTLRKFIDQGQVLVYVDDVLIMSSMVDEGIELLRQVLKTLTEAGFSINLRKCSFLVTEVEYLGRIVSQGQVKPSSRKVEALVHAPVPTNVKQVRQLLGLAGYFRRYIKNYATKTACITHLTKKGVTFNWGPEQEAVRQDLIQQLTSKPILAIFDPKLDTEVHTDASSAGYGAVFLQAHADGKKHVVSYFSKVTQGAEKNYHSYELETLAVVKALQQFRHYLVGLHFKVVTDCNALKATERKKDLLPRVARWWIYLQDFDFSIEYRKGVMMPHADYLSRNPPVTVNQISRPKTWAQIAQSADEDTQNLMQQLQEGNLDSSRYVVQNDLLYYRYVPAGEEPRLLCYIPKGHRLSLLRVFHDEHEHINADKTADLILKHFWFPGLHQFVRKYIAHCVICISKKRVPRSPHQTITSWEKPEVPFNTVHMDALGPLPVSEGYKFILVLVDAFTKFCLLYPIYRQDVGELKRATTQAIALFGVPKLIVTDRGRMFESNEFVSWVNEMGCSLHYITPEMHHANGQAERYIRTVLNMLRIEVNHRNASWSDTLWKIQLVLNITKQKTTQTSALNLMIGTDATTPVIRALVRDVALSDSRPNREALREVSRSRARDLLRKNQEQQDSYTNKNRSAPRVFQVEDKVFVIKYSQSTGKLDPGMRGPYKVTKTLPNGRYELKLLGGGYGKTTQAAAQYMVPWRGEWCPETCAAFFDNLEDDGANSDDVLPLPVSDREDQDIDQAGPSTIAAGGPTSDEGVHSDHDVTITGLSMPLLD